MPPWSNGHDVRLSTGKRGFDSRRGYARPSACREAGHPVGFGSRRSLVRLQPGRLRGRGVAVLASLMSSRPRVRIPPAHLADVAQTCRALGCLPRGRRFKSGHPRSWWSWCNGSIRGRDPRGAGSNPVDRLLLANAEHPVSSAACNAVASRCGGSTPPVRISLHPGT